MSRKVQVVGRTGKKYGDFETRGVKLDAFKAAFQKQNKVDVSRQYFTYENKELAASKDPKDKKKSKVAIKDYSADLSKLIPADVDTITFKDLGPQIGWDTVFYIEYFGPILMHCLVYFLPQLFYAEPSKEYHHNQKLAFACVVGHYLKRELETKFVHRFSNGTMPLFNVFKNSTHYWLFGGLFIAYFLYHPQYTPIDNDLVVNVCVVLFVLCELGNLVSHITLRNLRPPGTRARGIPRGGMFEFTTCANYTYEVFAWLFFSIFTNVLTAWLFLVISTVQISLWSLKKHVAMKKEFGDKVPRRKILFPFIW